MSKPAAPAKAVPATQAPRVSTADLLAAPRFAACLKALLATEGGFSDHRADRGGPTNLGISLRFLRSEAAINPRVRALFTAGAIEIDDIRNLTVHQAARIYRWCFWDVVQCDRFAPPIDAIMFDQAVNAGPHAAILLLQTSINRANGRVPALLVDQDGMLGPKTVAAANAIDPEKLAAAFRTIVANRYQALVIADRTQEVFLRGWLRRAANLGKL